MDIFPDIVDQKHIHHLLLIKYTVARGLCISSQILICVVNFPDNVFRF